MSKLVKFTLTIILVVALSFNLSANGLNLNSNGSKALAMGGAFIGLANDFSAAFWNPAGLTQLKSKTLSVFGTGIMPTGTYKFAMAGIDAQTKSGKIYPSGALGYFNPIGDNLVIGIYGYVPAGAGAQWDGGDLVNLAGANYEWESMVGAVSISPSIAYRVSDIFSLGATVNITYGMIKLKSPGAGQNEEDLHGWGFGATLGALLKPSDKFSVGLSVKLPMPITVSGTSTMSGVAYNQIKQMLGAFNMVLNAQSDAERKITWPLWAGLGFAFKPTEKLTITADVQYTNWKKLQTVAITYTDQLWSALKGHPNPLLAPLAQAFNKDFHLNWKDTVQIRVGGEYFVSDSFALRGGFYTDPSPALDATINILLPQINYNFITCGIGYKTDKIALDVGFEYGIGKDRTTPVTAVYGMPGIHGMNIMVPNVSFTIFLD